MNMKKHWKEIPRKKTLLQYFRLLEGHYMWATAALFITTSTFSIRFLLKQDFSETIFGNHFIFLLSLLFKIALAGIIISIVLTFLTVPPPPKKINRLSLLWQWILLPLTTIFFGSLPAIVTQTQMALGGKMGFEVTEKVKKK